MNELNFFLSFSLDVCLLVLRDEIRLIKDRQQQHRRHHHPTCDEMVCGEIDSHEIATKFREQTHTHAGLHFVLVFTPPAN
jgi:hypothetical protein